MDDAREDAVAWKATGKLRMSWKPDGVNVTHRAAC